LTFWGERRFICHIKAERKDGKIAMSGVTIKKQTEASKQKPCELKTTFSRVVQPVKRLCKMQGDK